MKQSAWMLIGLLLAAPAWAGRMFPADAKPGELQGMTFPQARINDKIYRMAPGLRIRDTNNRIVVPNAAPTTGKVMYQLDTTGNLLQMWVLTPDEIARLPK